MLRLAIDKDLIYIMEIIKKIIEQMKENNINQWDENYPNKDIFSKDIYEQNLYVFDEENQIKGFVVLNEEVHQEYNKLNWRSEKKFKVIHRMGIDPKYKRQGIGEKIFKYIETEVIKLGYEYIKVDTYSKNLPMINLIKKKGYVEIGKMVFDKNKKNWIGYDLIIKN